MYAWCVCQSGKKKQGGGDRPKSVWWLGTCHMPCVNKEGKVVASGWASPSAFKGNLEALAVEGGKVQWATGQLEKGEETGAEHIQVLVRFRTAQRLTAVVSMFARVCVYPLSSFAD